MFEFDTVLSTVLSLILFWVLFVFDTVLSTVLSLILFWVLFKFDTIQYSSFIHWLISGELLKISHCVALSFMCFFIVVVTCMSRTMVCYIVAHKVAGYYSFNSLKRLVTAFVLILTFRKTSQLCYLRFHALSVRQKVNSFEIINLIFKTKDDY